MNSLVVLFSVLALAAAEPSTLLEHGAFAAYAAPTIYAAPTAYSSQSRVDIKSSPAVVTTAAVAPIVAPTAYAAYAAPAVYAAPAAIAPAAVSHQSRIDIKSSPAIYQTYAAAPVALAHSAAYITPTFGARAHLIRKRSVLAAPAFTTYAHATPAYSTYAYATPAVYAAPAAIAPAAVSHQSHIDIKSSPAIYQTYAAAPVALAHSAAYITPTFGARAHLIRKRSVLATPAITTFAHAAPLSYSTPYFNYGFASYSPLSYSTPYLAKAYGIHPW